MIGYRKTIVILGTLMFGITLVYTNKASGNDVFTSFCNAVMAYVGANLFSKFAPKDRSDD